MPKDTLSKILISEHRKLCRSRGCSGCANRGDHLDNDSWACRIGEWIDDTGYCRQWEEDLDYPHQRG